MKEELKQIEALGHIADQCNEDIAIELNRRLLEILQWVNERLRDGDTSPGP